MVSYCGEVILGFSKIKRLAIQKLREGAIQHEERKDKEKNLLALGYLTNENVVDILKYCTGNCYKSAPHDMKQAILVHIFTPRRCKYEGYYVKLYFIEPDVWFISVHD